MQSIYLFDESVSKKSAKDTTSASDIFYLDSRNSSVTFVLKLATFLISCDDAKHIFQVPSLSRHVLTVSDFQILIKSCSIESRNDPSPKSEVVHQTKFSLKISYSTHVCLAQLDRHQTCKPVMVSCEFNSHWRQLYFLKTPRC